MTAQRFREDFKQFLLFVRRPSLARRVPRSLAVAGWLGDWWPNIRLPRLLAWAAALWTLNILVLGPLVLVVFELSGATHRISVHNLPWLQAILWAPIVEEMLFRFGLRRPVMALGLVPLMVFVLLNGVAWWASSLLALAVAKRAHAYAERQRLPMVAPLSRGVSVGVASIGLSVCCASYQKFCL